MEEVAAPQGWQARLDLKYGLRGSKTRLIDKRQHGPLTLQRSFYPEGNTCHNYILHPPGGVVGDDSLQINVSAGLGTHCLLTTPGATKFYRSQPQCSASQLQTIDVADGAIMEWLPQQNIFFNGANAALTTRIDINPGGRFIGWEMHCFGRPANNETVTQVAVRSQTRVNIAGELRLIEQFYTRGSEALLAATGLRGASMQGCFIAAPCTEVQRQLVEQVLWPQPDAKPTTGGHYPDPVGVTLVDEVLVVRALGEQTEPMLELFTQLWMALRRGWLQKAPCSPRIWAT